MIACYLELYEEGEVEHINGPTHPFPLPFAFKGRSVTTRLGTYRVFSTHVQTVSGAHCSK